MHELGMCEPLVAAVCQRAAGRPVTAVRVRVGVLHRAVGPAMQQAFAMAASGTEAADAAVDLVVLPARSRCERCGTQAESGDADALVLVCPSCGGTDMTVVGGDELVLESLTLAERGRTDGRSAHVPGHPR